MKNIFTLRETPYPLQFLYYGTVFQSFHEITLSANATQYIQIKSGVDRLSHWLSTIFSHNGVDVSVELFESPTFTADGTTIINGINYNRQSNVTAQLTAYNDNPDATSDGTCISRNRLFGASGGVGQATSAADLEVSGIEILLKKNIDYTLKVTNNTATITNTILHWSWYESGN